MFEFICFSGLFICFVREINKCFFGKCFVFCLNIFKMHVFPEWARLVRNVFPDRVFVVLEKQ